MYYTHVISDQEKHNHTKIIGLYELKLQMSHEISSQATRHLSSIKMHVYFFIFQKKQLIVNPLSSIPYLVHNSYD